MADYATINTARLRVRYTQGGKQHTFQIRAPHGAIGAQGDLVSRANSILAAIAPALFADWSVLGADFAARDSEIFLPVGGVNTPAGKSSATPVAFLVPAFVGFVGRSAGGSRVRLTLFGTVLQASMGASAHDYRIQGGENGFVDGTIVALNNGAGGSSMGGIDGGAVSWYSYANIGYNAHWQRELRG